VEAGIFPREEFWQFSQYRPSTRVSRTFQNRGPDLHQDGGIVEKTSLRRKNLSRQMRSCTGGICRPTGLTGPWYRSDRSMEPVSTGINTPSFVLGRAAFVTCP